MPNLRLRDGMILVEELSPEIQKLVDGNDIDKALSLCTDQSQREEVYDTYLAKRFPKYGKVIEPYKDILIKLLVEIGVDNNPFLDFVDLFYRKTGINNSLSSEGFIALNNLYADGIIEDADLRGTGKDFKNASLLLKQSLYRNNSADDIENIVRSYEWLGEKYRIENSINRTTIQFPGNPKTYTKEELVQSPKLLQDLVVFKSGNAKKDDVRSFKEISEILEYLEEYDTRSRNTVKAQGYKPKNKTIQVKDTLSDKDIAFWDDKLSKLKLNKNTATSLLAYLSRKNLI